MSNLSTVFNTTDGILEPLQEIEDALKQMYVLSIACIVELNRLLCVRCPM